MWFRSHVQSVFHVPCAMRLARPFVHAHVQNNKARYANDHGANPYFVAIFCILFTLDVVIRIYDGRLDIHPSDDLDLQ